MSRVDFKTTRGSELKRGAILQAALELFVERGFHGTSVPSVAARAQVGAGTIYRYFANKEALVNELFREQKQAISRYVLTGFPVQESAREQHREFWRRMAAFAADHRQAFAFLELHSHRDYLDAESRAVEQVIVDFGLAFVRNAQASGQVKPLEPMLLIAIVFGAFVGLIRQSVEGHLELTESAIINAEACVWQAIAVATPVEDVSD